MSRAHLLATVAKAMRQILIDHARRRKAQKRGGNYGRIQLDQAGLDEAVSHGAHNSSREGGAAAVGGFEFDELHAALRRLEDLNPRQSEIVELRFFGGLTVEEVAQVLSISPRTVKLDWQFARAWLLNQLRESPRQ